MVVKRSKMLAILMRRGAVADLYLQGWTQTAIQIRTPDELPIGGNTNTEEHGPGKRTVSWRGTVPPQKWMNFYTMVLTKFASHPELTLEVSFQVTLDKDQTQVKADETRTSLKELGLDDDVSCT